MRHMNARLLAAGLLVMAAGPAHSQSILQLAGTTYENTFTEPDDTEDLRLCEVRKSQRREIRVSEGARADLTVTTESTAIFDSSTARSQSLLNTVGNYYAMKNGGRAKEGYSITEAREACEEFDYSERVTSEVSFDSGSMRFSQTITSGEQAGSTQDGRFQILDSGRKLVMNYDEGTKRIYDVKGRVQVGNMPASAYEYLIPDRTPDIVLSCSPVSVRQSTYNTTNSHGGNSSSNYSSGSSGTNYNNSSTTSGSCEDKGWQNRKIAIRIWQGEQRCEGYACDINAAAFQWRGNRVDRMTGQTEVGCYVYQCEKAATAQPKF
ncbi:hypothetical protein C3942_07335 [Solimonas fluminis]|uniref:Uncharacterized protein n=2 Tax=Solimonas fluminis TaxID=2086571 RepID=A0A2S5THV1_9GAMM|nr:hypothetical protein C3942_07335 [Solimonas fluminis]